HVRPHHISTPPNRTTTAIYNHDDPANALLPGPTWTKSHWLVEKTVVIGSVSCIGLFVRLRIPRGATKCLQRFCTLLAIQGTVQETV
ncbi:hypothetical protein BDN72DRAFT_840750, partial [Pluteus cervinus]